MGQTLSSPVLRKHSDSGGNGRFCFGVSAMQGWRITMEDAHAAVLDLDKEAEISNMFFAVYDGHGGGNVAKFAGQNVHKRLATEEAYLKKQYEAALKRAFLGTDEDLLADPTHARDPSGCTAVAALVTNDDKIYVANAGDSRSVMGTGGKAKALSFDHKPTNETERSRIHSAGGYIEFGRVNGNLALSRALGDFEFKRNLSLTPEKQIITADPDVTCHEIADEDEFFVMACDGIWDCLSSQQVVDIVRRQVAEGKELFEICEMICDHCLAPDTSGGAGVGCDNMTILIIAILNGRTKEAWYSWVRQRVESHSGYSTPTSLPSLYSAARLASFRARREVQERARQQAAENERQAHFNPTLSRNTIIIGSRNDPTIELDYDDDSVDGEMPGEDTGSSSLSKTVTLGHPEPGSLEFTDATKHLREQLEEFEKEIQHESKEVEVTDSGQPPNHLDETTSPAQPAPNGVVAVIFDEESHSPPDDQQSQLVAKGEGPSSVKEESPKA